MGKMYFSVRFLVAALALLIGLTACAGDKPLFQSSSGGYGSNAWSQACRFTSPSENPFSSTAQQRKDLESLLTKLGKKDDVMYLRPSAMWPYLRGRTLWLIGDSHMKTLYLAFGCFFSEYWKQQECAVSTDKSKVQQLFATWEGSPIQASCIHLPSMTRICLVKSVLGTSLAYNNKVPDGGYLRFVQKKLARKGDIFYVSFGAWHRKTPNFPYNAEGYNKALQNLDRYYQETRSSWPHVFFVHTPAAHPNWKTGNTCPEYQGVTLERAGSAARLAMSPALRKDLNRNPYTSLKFRDMANSALKGSGIPTLGDLSFQISVVGGDQHYTSAGGGQGDCIHFVHPGVPEIWVWELYQALRSGATGLKPLAKFPSWGSRFSCAGVSSVL